MCTYVSACVNMCIQGEGKMLQQMLHGLSLEHLRCVSVCVCVCVCVCLCLCVFVCVFLCTDRFMTVSRNSQMLT